MARVMKVKLKKGAKNFLDKMYVTTWIDTVPNAPKVRVLNANEKKALEIMERHLDGYKGVLTHSVWTGLRDDIVYLVENRKVRKAPSET